MAASIYIEIQRRYTRVFMGSEVFIEINVSSDVKLYIHIQATNFHGYLWALCFKISLVLTFWCTDTGFCVLIIQFTNIHASLLQHAYIALMGMVKQPGRRIE